MIHGRWAAPPASRHEHLFWRYKRQGRVKPQLLSVEQMHSVAREMVSITLKIMELVPTTR
jgi:hypothetical protein